LIYFVSETSASAARRRSRMFRSSLKRISKASFLPAESSGIKLQTYRCIVEYGAVVDRGRRVEGWGLSIEGRGVIDCG
jgi:transcription initiation factor TFIIIB Brf1 subunit/transcription initiation factor TFIIB